MSSQNELSQPQKETDFKQVFENYTLTLSQLLPKRNLKKKIKEIKRKGYDFITYCTKNKKIIYQMIDRGIKNSQFPSMYEKNLALFSVQALSGQMGQSYKLFIDETCHQCKSMIENSSEIEEEIEAECSACDKQGKDRYLVLNYLLSYLQRSQQQLQPICINYIIKILSNLVSTNPLDIYTFFSLQYNNKNITNNSAQQFQIFPIKNKLEYFLQLITIYPGISQLLSKLITEQTLPQKNIELKKQISEKVLMLLMSQQLLKNNPDNYKLLMDFVNFIFLKYKYKSYDANDGWNVYVEKFGGKNIIGFFIQHLVKATHLINQIVNNGNSNNSMNEIEKQKQLQILENIFQNSLNYLKIVIQKLNMDEEVTQPDTGKISQPALHFQVDEILFGQSTLDQLMKLTLPFSYKNINKMTYYEVLLKLTRNSRFHKSHLGLQSWSLQPVLTHLLCTFRKEFRGNGLVKFYIQELISQAILPKIDKLNEKQAMKVISAFNPSQEVLVKFDDYRVFTQKILIILQKKCQWFSEHFSKLGLNLHKIKTNYKTKLGGNTNILQNQKNGIKQFQFIYQDDQEKQQNSKKHEKQQKFNDDFKSYSSSEHQKQQQQMQQFNNLQKIQYTETDYFKMNFDTQLDDKYNSISKNNNCKNQYLEIEEDIIVSQQLGISSKIQQQYHHSNDNYHQSFTNKQNTISKSNAHDNDDDDLILNIDSTGEDNQDGDAIHEEVKNDNNGQPTP